MSEVKTLDQIGSEVKKLMEEFTVNHDASVKAGNKAAARRARNAINEIKKIATEYKKISVEIDKK
ncbi:MAG: hypothetical protein Q8880_10075 [Bacteroidota bacterium]|nr:hypothetical protein [Bacteroidota bacterium]